ncbi:Lnb N-terminal periplasmic domain-containing protein [Halomonas sp. WWR20]
MPQDTWPYRILHVLGRMLLALALLLIALWGSLAMWFQLPLPAWAKVIVIAGWNLLACAGIAVLLVPELRAYRWHAVGGYLLAFSVLCVWWASLRPANDRPWAPEVARMLSAEVNGDRVTLHNVRNFEWHTPETFTPRWETREYDLSQLRSTDLLVSYWMGPAIAHTLVSFGFADGRQLAFSVEIRRERDETFSTLGGFFKQFEVSLIAADERDIVRVRSNVRGEDVYLYRVGLPEEAARELFLSYLEEAHTLHDQPRFYNTLFTNCTTLVFDMVKRIVPGLPTDIRLILSGYLPHYIHDQDGLDTSRPFEELQARGYINPRAMAADRDKPPGQDALEKRSKTDFSAAIRRGVPTPDGGLIAPEVSEFTAPD